MSKGSTAASRLTSHAPRVAGAPGKVTREADERRLITRIDAGLRRGDVESAAHAARLLRQRLRQIRLLTAGPDDELALAHLHLALAAMAVADTLSASTDLVNAARAAQHHPDTSSVRRYIDALSGLVHAVRGSLPQARRLLTPARVVSASFDSPDLVIHHTTLATRSLLHAETLLPVEPDPASWDAIGAVREHAVLWPARMLADARLTLYRSGPATALESLALAEAAHRIEPGSLAADVLTALSAHALLLVGGVDEAHARIQAERSPGPLTRIAAVRTSIYRGDPLAALTQVRRLTPSPLSVGDRGELLLLEAWAHTLSGGPVDPTTARALAQLATAGGHRRIFTTVPRSVLDALSAPLLGDLADSFAQIMSGLSSVPDLVQRPQLSARESQALSAIAAHGTVSAAAEALYISPNTLKTHLASVYRKLGVADRTQAVAAAMRFRLIADPPQRAAAAPTGTGGEGARAVV